MGAPTVQVEYQEPLDPGDVGLRLYAVAQKGDPSSKTLQLRKDFAEAKWLRWTDEDGNVFDRWDGHLLDAVYEARTWLEERPLLVVAKEVNLALQQYRRAPTS